MAARYAGPPEALERYDAAVALVRGVDRKGAANPYTSMNGHMFSFLDTTGTVSIRLSKEDTARFRATHESGDSTQYGRTMRGYSTVPDELLLRTADLAAWIERSRAHIAGLPPK